MKALNCWFSHRAWLLTGNLLMLMTFLSICLAVPALAQPFSNDPNATKNNQNMVRTERGWVTVYQDNQRIKVGFKPFSASGSNQNWQIFEVPPDPNPSPSLEVCIGAKEIYDGTTNLRTMVFVPWVLSEQWNDKIHMRRFRITGTVGSPPYTIEMLDDQLLPLPAGFSEGEDTRLTSPTIGNLPALNHVPMVFVGVNSAANPSTGGSVLLVFVSK